ncbi:MAG: hypothetical protein E6G95_16615 [Alphaproteobacteria bacterium]|nr:MAG: hypothetical protein E6G95_16615 [Alphaproteobacteria bacterium]
MFRKLAAAVLAVTALPVAAFAATIGGTDYATQYDYREFYTVADGKPFQVVLAGEAFPGLAADAVALRLLPLMQANKPRPRLTFTYDTPAERPRPYYRVVLIFNAANDLSASSVCATGQTRFRPGVAGRVHIFAVYCRNELALSQLTGWTGASGPDDPRMGELFKDVFAQVFSDAPWLRPQNTSPSFR